MFGRVGCFLLLLGVAVVVTIFIPPLGLLLLFVLALAALFAR